MHPAIFGPRPQNRTPKQAFERLGFPTGLAPADLGAYERVVNVYRSEPARQILTGWCHRRLDGWGVEHTGDLLAGQPVGEQAEDFVFACGELVAGREPPEQLVHGGGLQHDSDVGVVDRERGGLHAQPVAADRPEAGRRAAQLAAAHRVSGVEQHPGHVARVGLVVTARHGSVVVVVGRVFVEYASQVLLADDEGPIEEFPA